MSPSPADEGVKRVMSWGSNFYTSELGIKTNVWEVFKKGMRELDILVLDSVGVPFDHENHLNIRGNSNEVIKIIKPGFKVTAWAIHYKGKTLAKASVITS